jgi:hypothetical protein
LPAPLDQAKRDAILADINAGHKTRNQIARDHQVSGSTVTKIAGHAKGSAAFDRSQTENATRARQADNAAVRAELIARYYKVAGHFLDRVESEYTQVVAGPAGPEFVTTRLPPLRDAQAGMSASAIAVDKALRLEDRNGDGRVDAAKSLLGSLFKTLQDAHGDSPDGSG